MSEQTPQSPYEAGKIPNAEMERLKKFAWPDQVSFQLLPADLHGKTVLDVGSGPRTKLGNEIEHRGGSYIGLDLNPEVLTSHQLEAPDHALVRGNVLQLPAHNVDIAHTRFVLTSIPRQKRTEVVLELARVAKQNYMLEWDWDTFRPTTEFLKQFVNDMKDTVADMGTNLNTGAELEELIRTTLGKEYVIEKSVHREGPGLYYAELIDLAEGLGVGLSERLGNFDRANRFRAFAKKIREGLVPEEQIPFERPDIVAVMFEKKWT